jgi:hypothetical protein
MGTCPTSFRLAHQGATHRTNALPRSTTESYRCPRLATNLQPEQRERALSMHVDGRVAGGRRIITGILSNRRIPRRVRQCAWCLRSDMGAPRASPVPALLPSLPSFACVPLLILTSRCTPRISLTWPLRGSARQSQAFTETEAKAPLHRCSMTIVHQHKASAHFQSWVTTPERLGCHGTAIRMGISSSS